MVPVGIVLVTQDGSHTSGYIMGTLWSIEHVVLLLAAVLTFSIQAQPKSAIHTQRPPHCPPLARARTDAHASPSSPSPLPPSMLASHPALFPPFP